LQTVIVILSDRIPFVFMATGALYGGGAKAVQYVGNHIIPIQITGNFSIHLGFRHLHVSDKIPWPCR
jgi:hypothetical protein